MNDTKQAINETGSEKPKSKKKRKWLKWVVIVGVLLVVFIGLIPTLLNMTGLGASIATDQVNGIIKGKVEIKGVTLSWLGDQGINGVVLKDPDGQEVVNLKEMTLGMSLLDAIKGDLNVTSEVDGLKVDMRLKEGGQSNLERAIALRNPAPETDEPTKVPTGLKLNVKINNAEVNVVGTGTEPVEVNDLNVHVKQSGITQPLQFELSTRTRQGAFQGTLKGKGELKQLFSADGTLTTDQMMGDVALTGEKLPLDAVDSILKMDEWLTALSGAGSMADLNINISVKPEQATAQVKLTSPRIQTLANLNTNFAQLSQPDENTTLSLILTQQFFNRLMRDSGEQVKLQLMEDVPVELTIEKLTVPLKKFNVKESILVAKLKATKDFHLVTHFKQDTENGQTKNVEEHFVAKGLEGELKIEKESGRISVALGTQTLIDDEAGVVSISGYVDGVEMGEEGLLMDQLKPNLSVEVKNIPTPLVTRLAQLDARIADTVGQRVSLLKLNASSAKPGEYDVTFEARTPNVVVNPVEVKASKTAYMIAKASTGEVNIPKEAVNAWLKNNEAEAKDQMGIEGALRGELVIGPLEVPLQDGKVAVHAGKGGVDVKLGTIVLAGLPEVGKMQFEGGTVNAVLNDSSRKGLTVKWDLGIRDVAAAKPDKPRPMLSSLGMKTMHVSGEMQGNMTEENALSVVTLTGRVFAEGDELVTLRGRADMTTQIIEGLVVDMGYTITPAVLNYFDLAKKDQPTIAQPVPVKLSLSLKDQALENIGLKMLRAGLKLTADEIQLTGTEAVKGMMIQDVIGVVDYAGGMDSGSALLNVSGNVSKPDAPIVPLKVDGKITNLLDEAGSVNAAEMVADVTGGTELRNTSTAGLLKVGGVEDPKLVKLLGEDMTVNVDLHVQYAKQALTGLDADLMLKSQNASLVGKADVKDQKLDVKQGELKLTMTPATFAEYISVEPAKPAGENNNPVPNNAGNQNNPPASKSEPLVLKEPFEVTFDIKKLLWPMSSAEEEKPKDNTNKVEAVAFNIQEQPAKEGDAAQPKKEVSLDALGIVTEMKLFDPNSKTDFVVKRMKIGLNNEGADKPLTLKLDGGVQVAGSNAAGEPNKVSPIALNVVLRDWLNAKGGFNSEKMGIGIDGVLEAMPVVLLDQLGGQDGLLLAAIGPRVDMKVNGFIKEMQGSIGLNMTATHASLEMDGRLEERGLVLAKPLTAEFIPTEKLGKQLLKNINPIFESMSNGEQPITLTIPNEGFIVPLKDFTMSKVNMKQAKLSLGKLKFQNGGTLMKLLGFATKYGGLKDKHADEEFNLHFTPLVVSVNQGVLSYDKRLDFLVDNAVHMGTWGSVNLETNNFNLVIGFMGETLDRVFGVDGVDPNEALRIPVTGTGERTVLGLDKAAADYLRVKEMKKQIANLRSRLDKEPLLKLVLQKTLDDAVKELYKALGIGDPIPEASQQPLPWGKLPELPPDQRKEGADNNAKPVQPESNKAPDKKKSAEETVKDLLDLFKK